MGAAQTVMLVGSLLLLVVLSLNFTLPIVENQIFRLTVKHLQQLQLFAVYARRNQTRAFDEKTISSAVYQTDSLTLAASFGPEAEENT